MTFKNFELYEDGDKYYELIPLYNAWHTRTMLMSVGNTNVEEWDRLMEYCVNNKKETAHFFLDLIDAYDRDETYANDYVGFFLDIVAETFKDDGIPIFESFVGGDIAQRIYKVWVERYLGIIQTDDKL